MVGLLLLLLHPSVSFAQLGDWVHEKTENRIEIYSKKNDQTGVKEVYSRTQISCSLEHLMGILHNVDDATSWMPYYERSETLEYIDSKTCYNYVEVKVPWPLNNRDIVVEYSYTIDSTKTHYISTFFSTPNYIPEKKGIVRIKISRGSWTITQLETNSVLVEYRIMAHPGMDIPSWIINIFILEAPINGITNLRNFAEKTNKQTEIQSAD